MEEEARKIENSVIYHINTQGILHLLFAYQLKFGDEFDGHDLQGN